MKTMVSRGVDRILREKRGLLINFDAGLEEGPKDFNSHSIDPNYTLNIAREGQYTGFALQQGIAGKYLTEQYREVPAIIKLNGKTALQHINPLSRQLCSVERAVKLGAQAIGYTIYDGTPAESTMFAEFGHIVEQAHDYGVPVVAWMHPKQGHHDTDTTAYAARIALELGADAVILKYPGDKDGFAWAVQAAGRCRVFAADPETDDDHALLHHVADAMRAGAAGFVIGKTLWRHPKPFSLTRALHAVVFKEKSAEEAITYLQ